VTWRKVRAGCYDNAAGTHRIERDSGSLDEYDTPSDVEWFIYTLPLAREDYGPPDAIAEFPTLREAKASLNTQLDNSRRNLT
jgi:hypothetical protein